MWSTNTQNFLLQMESQSQNFLITSVADSAIEDDSTVSPSAVAQLGYKEHQKLCMDYGIG